MRTMAYALAVLAAIGIVVAIATMPEGPPPDAGTQNATAVSTEGRVMSDAGTLTLNVPKMHCPFACYPSVKKTLEATAAVESVELAEQKEEGLIDNPQVIVQYKGGFNLDEALALLESKGFGDSEIVQ